MTARFLAIAVKNGVNDGEKMFAGSQKALLKNVEER